MHFRVVNNVNQTHLSETHRRHILFVETLLENVRFEKVGKLNGIALPLPFLLKSMNRDRVVQYVVSHQQRVRVYPLWRLKTVEGYVKTTFTL